MHFTPTSGSWLNMVEIFFGIITRQAIRRGTFTSVNDLIAAIEHLHRRLERPLPAVHLDQDRRRDHPARHPRSKNFNSATLVACRFNYVTVVWENHQHGLTAPRPPWCWESRRASSKLEGSGPLDGPGGPGLAARAGVVLLAADGVANYEIAELVGVCRGRR